MSIIEHAPAFELDELAQLAERHFGVTGTLSRLPSERDQNVLIESDSGEHRVLKIANRCESRDVLIAQNAMMDRIATAAAICPQVHLSRTSKKIVEIESVAGGRHFMRLLTWLPGQPLGALKYHPPVVLKDLGRVVGQLSLALEGFDHTALHRDFHWDLRQAPEVVAAHVGAIIDDETRRGVHWFNEVFETVVAPRIAGLRIGIIHNDANDYNVIVDPRIDPVDRTQKVRGVIDFGDVVQSFTVADLAVAIAYAMLEKRDPLDAARRVVEGYHEVFPLDENELAVLFPLAAMRLSISACHAAHQQQDRPGDPYLSISQKPIAATLPTLAAIPPVFAEACFRAACGKPPLASGPRIAEWLQQQDPTPIIDVECGITPLVLDLGITSTLVSGDEAENSTAQLTARIWQRMQSAGAECSIARYDEPRLLYTSPLFAEANGRPGENRTIHLGLDLFANTGTAVFAPLDGKVHLAGINNNELDYGGVVILEHETEDRDVFYTLYGHLAHDSVRALEIGTTISRGEAFVRLGRAEENGGWAPHLHFQLVLDLLDRGLDFPGVCRPSERHIWTALSPDPNLLLQLPFENPAGGGIETTLAERRRLLAPSLSIGYHQPLKIERGWRQYLFDHEGRRYLDAYNNVPHIGHCHPEVVEAAAEQMSIINTNTRYLHDWIQRYAERLCATMPAPLEVCFFVNSASEGNELALRLARAATNSKDLIVLEGAYHGHTTSLIDISPYKHDGPGGRGAPDWVHTAPVADLYRGAFKADDPEAAMKYAAEVDKVIASLHADGKKLGGFIAESYPSVGGQIIPPDGYLATVYESVRGAGGICIADEVQTGYGRIGTHFYAFEAQGLVPDIVVLGKPIGNGHPISAVVTTRAIAEAFDTGMEFFSTFGGNTVSCAVGLKVLEITQRDGFQQHAAKVGSYLLARLQTFKGRFPLVGDVRGAGLFLGIELVRDHTTLEPAAAEACYIADRMRDEGILLGTDGPLHNVVKIRPPLPFDECNADQLADTMERIFANELS